MPRIADLLPLLLPIVIVMLWQSPPAGAVIYQLEGPSRYCFIESIGDDVGTGCTAQLRFGISPAKYGQVVNPQGTMRIFHQETLLGAIPMLWAEQYPGADFCADACSFAETDAGGTLVSLDFNCNDCPGSGGGTISFWQARLYGFGPGRFVDAAGTWSVTTLPIPLPPTLPLLLSAVGLMVPWRCLKCRITEATGRGLNPMARPPEVMREGEG